MATRFWVGGTGTWDASDTTHWSATSGGGTGASVPTTADTVTFNASSGTGTCTIAATANCSTLTSSSANITIVTGSNIINLAATSGTVWNWTGGTFTGGSSTIVVTTAATGTRTFAGGGQTGYGTLTYTVANSPGILSVTGNNTWAGTWNTGPGRIVQCPSGGTQTGTGANWLGGVQGSNYGYVYLPGLLAASVPTVPDSAALSLTGDMDFRVRVAPDDWTPAVSMRVLAKRTGASGATISYDWNINAAGTLTLSIGDGATSTTVTSTASTGFVDGTAHWIRVTRRNSDGRVQFFTAADAAAMPSSWTQLGTDLTNTRAGQDTADAVYLGGVDNATSLNSMTGKLYRVQMRSNVLDDGTGIVLDADFTTKPFGANTFTESSSNAATVTINGTLAQAGDGRVMLQAVSGTTTLATGSGSTMTYTVPDHILATPSKAVYVLDGVDGGSNTGIVFDPPDPLPQDIAAEGRSFIQRQAVSRAGRW